MFKVCLHKAVFIAVALAFFIVPWAVPGFRNYAPGIAVIAGIIFAVTVGNPFARFTGKLSSTLLGVAIVGMGCGMNLEKVLAAAKRNNKFILDLPNAELYAKMLGDGNTIISGGRSRAV